MYDELKAWIAKTEHSLGYVIRHPRDEKSFRWAQGQLDLLQELSLWVAAQEKAKTDVPVLKLNHQPKFRIGQLVLVDRSGAAKGGYIFKSGYYGRIVHIKGRSGSFVSVFDAGSGFELQQPHSFEYAVREYDGKINWNIPESELELVEEDGA